MIHAFEFIPFPKMSPEDFINFLRDYGDLFTDDELKRVIKEMADCRQGGS